MKPLCIDLFCGLGGWAEGFLAEGYDVIGFDIERHRYPKLARRSEVKCSGLANGTFPGGGIAQGCLDQAAFTEEWDEYPGQLVLQDVLTLDGRQFRNAAVIVASPPCQKYSYMAMPWKRGKELAAWYRQSPAKLRMLNELFDACFRIAREAGVPLVVENVRGAQPWMGRAAWHYGSFYLWGDVPALMPTTAQLKNSGGSCFGERDGKPLERNDPRDMRRNGQGEYVNASAARGWNHPGKSLDGTKQGGEWWHDPKSMTRRFSSRSNARKAASAQIAKIPFPLASWIAKCFKPDEAESMAKALLVA